MILCDMILCDIMFIIVKIVWLGILKNVKFFEFYEN